MLSICKIRSGNEEPYSEKDSLLQDISELCHESGIKKHKGSIISKKKIIAELGREARENNAVLFANEDCSVKCENIETDNVIVVDHDYQDEVKLLRLHNPDSLVPSNSDDKMQETSNTAEVSKVPGARNAKQNKENEPGTSTKRHIFEPTRRRSDKNRTLKKDALAYLNEKQDKENIIRSKELELEERRISIREREVAIEERKLRLLEEKYEIDILETRETIELEKERFKLELADRKTTNALLESQQKIIDNLLKNFQS